MSQTPSSPLDDDLNPGEYGFADLPPVKRDAPQLKHDKYATSEPEPEEDARPRKRRRKRGDGDPRDEPADLPKKKRRDLAEEPPPDAPLVYPWWYWTLVLTGVGLVGLLAAVIVIAVQGGAKLGALALVAGVIGVVVETAAVAVILAGVGVAMGIDYGPVKEAIAKLFGCVAFVNGFTLALGLICYNCTGPLGILMAMSTVTLVTFAVFQAQFKLNMFEGLVTVFTIQGCAWAMACGLGFAYMNTLR